MAEPILIEDAPFDAGPVIRACEGKPRDQLVRELIESKKRIRDLSRECARYRTQRNRSVGALRSLATDLDDSEK